LPERRGIVSVVTGGGKTAFALLAFQRLAATVEDLRLIVVAPTLALLDQWVVTLQNDLGLSPSEIAVYSGESKSRKPSRANVVVLNTARRMAADITVGAPCLFVVDECHRAGSPQNARALDVDALATLGLSATPQREFDDGFERWIEPALGPVIYEYDHLAAKSDGLIPDISLHNFRFPLGPHEQERYDALSRRISQRWHVTDDPRDDDVLKTLLRQRASVSIQSSRRVVAAVAVAERYPDRGLIFHERIESAERIARLLDGRGERVGLYHSGLGANLRRRNLELFRYGQVTKLVTCRSLDEGLNVPDATVAIVAASTRSTRQRIQRLGRVLRVSPGKDTATVCTLYATEPERDSLVAEEQRLEDIASVHWYEVRL
jgi:superfamily II DNA or RNA helicase